MGDMEQYEVEMLRRDHVIDQYEGWLAGYEYADEPRHVLISWKQIVTFCFRCGDWRKFPKAGAHTYECENGHVADRGDVQATFADTEKMLAHYRTQAQRMMCPFCLVMQEVHDEWPESYTLYNLGPMRYVLACHHEVTSPAMRLECYECPKIDGIAVPMRTVVRLGRVVEAHRDPTQTYVLECGHVTI